MELIFLGTGAGIPNRSRNVAGLALSWLPEAGVFWLFDCGEATQHQLWQSGLSLHRLERIYITHLHGDHVFGLPGVMSSRSALDCPSPLAIYGPPGLREWLDVTIRCSHMHIGYPWTVEEAPTPATALTTPVHSVSGVQVSAAWLQHNVPTLGYRVEEAEKAGRLRIDRLQSFGLAPGPVYGQLKRGESVTLPDGRTLHGRDVLDTSVPGRTVAVVGDTMPCEAGRVLAENADVLVHEATFTETFHAQAAAFGHSTARGAALIAEKANARHLILTHISARYQADGGAALLAEARAVFPGTELATDGYRYPIPHLPQSHRSADANSV